MAQLLGKTSSNRFGRGCLFASICLSSALLIATPLQAGGDLRIRGSNVIVGKKPLGVTSSPKVRVAPPEVTPSQTASPDVAVVNPSRQVNVAQKAAEASRAIRKLVDDGQLSASYVGLGRVAGQMVDMTLTNLSGKPINLNFYPGMVLEPGATSSAQPMMLEDSFPITLQPGESVNRLLNCYCLDETIPPPEKGQAIALDWSKVVETKWAGEVKILHTGLKLDETKIFNPVMTPLQHRRVVIQRSIWTYQGDQHDVEKLEKVVRDDGQGKLSKKIVRKIADSVYNDLVKTLNESKKLP